MTIAYILLGVIFGIVLTQSEALSWFRIQEMFRFHSPRMYLIIASAVATAAISVALIKRLNVRTFSGDPIVIPPKIMGRGVRYAAGGAIFGIGWALGGASPAPCSRSSATASPSCWSPSLPLLPALGSTPPSAPASLINPVSRPPHPSRAGLPYRHTSVMLYLEPGQCQNP